MNFDYFMPTKLIFGAGSLQRLGTEPLPGKHALIVISSGKSMRKYGYLDRVIKLLRQNGADSVVFDKILPNPIDRHVMEGAALARERHCDFVVGLGGGSSIDSAKCIAMMSVNEGELWDYISGGSGKARPVKNQPLPIIAITTTAGTGTEADPWAVTTRTKTGEKIGFGFGGTFPLFSIIDSELIQTVPVNLAIFQAFDALFHSTEGYIAKTANPISDLLALKAVEGVFTYLPKILLDPGDKEAWSYIALSNTLSGIVESISSCTSEHAIEHAMSGYHPELTHGAGLIAISLAYYSFFANKVPQRMIQLARAAGKTDARNPQDFIHALAELEQRCGVNEIRLSDYGVENDPSKYAAHARHIMPGLFSADPYPLTEGDVAEIIRKSYC